MLRKTFLFLLILLMVVSPCIAEEIGGVNLPDTLEMDQNRLVLNGGGVREKFFVDVYVAGLYLLQKSGDSKKIIQADEPMALRLYIISALAKSKQMEKAIREGFEKSTDGNITPIKSRVDEYVSIFKDKVTKGDFYDFVYLQGKGVEVYKNGKLILLIKGLDFKQALFGIWISERPVQKSLKKKMLGK
ncbi:MAG: chalcone isomerase family protein [Deltaproteobacteria bacterium]|nr:chalcone isomerase family protein [Deltaproteobacteria bacterium]MBW1814479.1 chalcone isomerase family protein [Deltaproteobacteria bacterium]MBW1984941.1 chalcone isomerase family protein [Deltaproteobacteria bacterium]